MAHGHPIANSYSLELEGHASRGADAGFDRLCQLVQMYMSGNELIPGVDYSDERAPDLLICQASGLEQRPVRRSFSAHLSDITPHPTRTSISKQLSVRQYTFLFK
jgi:hypothetical protein